jgi:hypothetical protein
MGSAMDDLRWWNLRFPPFYLLLYYPPAPYGQYQPEQSASWLGITNIPSTSIALTACLSWVVL